MLYAFYPNQTYLLLLDLYSNTLIQRDPSQYPYFADLYFLF